MYVDGKQLRSANVGRFGYQLAQRNRREQNVASVCLAGQRQRGTNWTKKGQKSILQQLPRCTSQRATRLLAPTSALPTAKSNILHAL